MRRLIARWGLLWFLIACAPAQAADPLTFDIAIDQVEITTGFNGADLVLYGTKPGSGEVVAVIEGPRKDMTVRRKQSVFGAWVNRNAITFSQVPGFYDYASSMPPESPDTIRKLERADIIPKPDWLKPVGRAPDKEAVRTFQEALIRNKKTQNLFRIEPKRIEFLHSHFFKARFYLPSNVPVGDYTAKVFLLNVNGDVISQQSAGFKVGQVGTSAAIHEFAHDERFIYGVLCVMLALSAGWISNRLRRRT